MRLIAMEFHGNRVCASTGDVKLTALMCQLVFCLSKFYIALFYAFWMLGISR